MEVTKSLYSLALKPAKCRKRGPQLNFHMYKIYHGNHEIAITLYNDV